MKIIKFTPKLAEQIKEGKKNVTFRLFDDKNLSQGDTFTLATREGKEVSTFGIGEITEVRLKTLATLTEGDFIGHEPVNDPVTYYQAFYGDEVNAETEVKIIEFKVLSID